MAHDDEIGEEVNQEEAEAVQWEVVKAIMGPAANELRFPGSQPVSLATSNVHLLSEHRYYVTWKADGTRYMLYISTMGTYLIDRSFKVRRVQMRWPTSDPRMTLKYNPAVLHNETLLDGEMVVDEENGTGKQTRRYLAYDIMQLRGKPLRHTEFKVQQTTGAYCTACATCDSAFSMQNTFHVRHYILSTLSHAESRDRSHYSLSCDTAASAHHHKDILQLSLPKLLCMLCKF